MEGDGDDNVAGDEVPSAPSDMMSVTSRKLFRVRKRQDWNNISY